MSYCIFGNAFWSDGIHLDEGSNHAEELLIKRGAEEGVAVLVGKEKVPQNLLKILIREAGKPDSTYVSFLMAGPKDMDHSEGILFLDGALPTSHEYREFMLSKLKALQRVLQGCFDTGSFSMISVIFSSAYSIKFPETACRISEMAQIAYEELRMKDWDATFKLNIKP